MSLAAGGFVSATTTLPAAAATSCGTNGTFSTPGTCSYTTSGEDTFVVPAGVTSLHVVADGGAGHLGQSPSGTGGAGAQVTADIPVTAGSTEYVEVGVGGGAGGTYGGGAGGGLSGIYACAGEGTTPGCALLVAGGGGGGGYYGQPSPNGGDGGAGGTGTAAVCSLGADGYSSSSTEGTSSGGAGGGCSAGGAGGSGLPYGGSAGSAGAGGSGGAGSYPGAQAGAGGGGGGYYGGGGGGGGEFAGGGYSGGGGGGGGSSFVESGATNVSMASAPGTPSVTITWSVAGPLPTPPNVTCSSPPNMFSTGYNTADGQNDPNWVVVGPEQTASSGGTPVTGMTEVVDPHNPSQGGYESSPANAVTLPPASDTPVSAIVGKQSGSYFSSPWGGAQWISEEGIGAQEGTGDWWYEYSFNLDPSVDPSSFRLQMSFFADNEVAAVFVNGVQQNGANLPQDQSGSDPYYYGGFEQGDGASTTLSTGWQTGLNKIVVQVKSGAAAEGFLAAMQASTICAVTVSVSGSETYGGTGQSLSYTSSPSNVALTGTLSCSIPSGLQAGTSTLSNPSCSGLAAPAGYTIDYVGAPGGFTVSPAAATVTAPSPTLTYGEPIPSLAPTYSGLTNGDTTPTTAPTCTTTATSSSPVGVYPVTCSGAADPNYTFSYTGGTLTITQATPAITWPNPSPITYGNALSATQLDATSPVAGTFSYSPAVGTVLDAGTHTLTASFTPKDTTDYTSATDSVTITIDKATPTLHWETPSAIEYGTPLRSCPALWWPWLNVGDGGWSGTGRGITFDHDLGGFGFGGFGFGCQLNAWSSLPGTFSYSPAAGTVLDAGSHTLTATFTPKDTTDYTTASIEVTLTVRPAPLWVIASSERMTLGSTPPAITPNYAGFMNGDTPASLSTPPSCATTASASSHPGIYESSCSGAADPNYSISYIPGRVLVVPGNDRGGSQEGGQPGDRHHR